jgi:hypothetical protein
MAPQRPKKRAAPRRSPTPESNGETAAAELDRLRAKLDMESTTWAPVDLIPILAGEETAEPPSILQREDGASLLYRAKLHSLYGEPEAGKGWVALKAAADELDGGARVVYVDFEDEAVTAVERLNALGVDQELIRDCFCYLRPDEPLQSELSHAEWASALEPRPSLVVIDGMTEALALEGIDLNDNTAVASWMIRFPRRVAYDSGAAVLIIDHQTKDSESRGRFAIGAQHKLAGIHVAYSIKVVKPFGRGLDGASRIKVEKDRLGHVRKNAQEKVIAEMEFKSQPEDRVSVELWPPNPEPEQWQPTQKMEEVSLVLETADGPLSRNAIVKAVGGREKTIDGAIRALEAEKHIRIKRGGEGKTTWHHSVEPYRAPERERA